MPASEGDLAPFQHARQGRSRSTRRYCGGRCRVAAFRAKRHAAKLRACVVEIIDRTEARALIRRYEHLRTVGNASVFFGLRDRAGRTLALVGFGHGPHASGGDVVLERGFTRRRAPANAASFLIE